MALGALRNDEGIGLGVAVALHLALAFVLVWRPGKDEAPPMPERMRVNLSTDVSLKAAAPDLVAESRAARAPILADNSPSPPPIEQAEPIPSPKQAAQKTPPKVNPAPDRPRPKPAQPGASKIGADFLPGSGASTADAETRMPASQIGASAKASLAQAIARQLKPHWNAPQGVGAEHLVTILAFELNPDGSLARRPRVVSQSGVSDSNRRQKGLHAERAIRAVQLAAPFDLPPEYYEAWKRVSAFRFDRKL